MRIKDFERYINALVTLWVGPVMYPGLLVRADNSTALIENQQYRGQFFIVDTDSITAVSCDTNLDTVEKFEAAKKAQEEKQQAAAAEYRRIADEIEKDKT